LLEFFQPPNSKALIAKLFIARKRQRQAEIFGALAARMISNTGGIGGKPYRLGADDTAVGFG